MVSTLSEVTCSAPVNIAIVKYWGKRDAQLLLPTNSSLSLTLSQDHLQSKTTLRLLTEGEDRLWLNGKEELISGSKRLSSVIQESRRIRAQYELLHPNAPRLAHLPMHICSVNNFPTAAGLASSASGFACLSFALHTALDLPLTMQELSRLARIGSGSACRSLFGGFVGWEMGTRDDGYDSMAYQVAPLSHWANMEALILVVSDIKKETGSTEGMQRTVETSELLQERLRIVPKRMQEMEKAILEKDFDTFAQLTMKDSNQFHSVCLDTYPPVFYLNDISKQIISVISAYNRFVAPLGKGLQVAYTFDAGPNAVLFLQKNHVPAVLKVINHFFPAPTGPEAGEYFGRAQEFLSADVQVDNVIKEIKVPVCSPGALKRIISTHVGDGPRVLASTYDPAVSLLNMDGLPTTLV